ncbi:MAG: SMP-30/gluconolactonase/LRE family protein [Burkholderiales bacterium]|nr:SMP-30/gluconolactonase/LRE family protein [Burkholderiales bacterium]MDE2453792.1 SMP-30/gluconolactonase/LRE family protein [Burkholderiales bacterium]
MPATAPLTRVGDQTDILGESPLWDERAQALYWIDIRRPALRRMNGADGRIETWTLPALVGSIALAEDGRLLVAMGDEVTLFEPASGRFETLARLPRRIEGQRFNDGRCDRQGRFFVGTMHNLTRAPEGVLYRLEGRGPLVPVLQGLCIPNSLSWSPDGRTMYFADSLRHAIEAFDYDPVRGTPGARRGFATTEPPGFPDGAIVDAEGGLWSAQFKASRVVRYGADGRVDRVIPMPVDKPTALAFGGANLERLYITSASQQMSAEELAAQPLAGALFVMDPGVRGLPEPRFVL